MRNRFYQNFVKSYDANMMNTIPLSRKTMQ